MSVYVYGDSYAVSLQANWQWYKQVAKHLQTDCYVSADFGVANEWICMQVYEDLVKNKHKPGDRVYVVMTASTRHWFLWDHPNVSNYENMRNIPLDHFGITKDQVHAVEQYYKHIQSGFIDSWKYDATSAWLNHYTKRFADMGVDMYILQGFANATDVLPVGKIEIKSNLFNTVCEGEFKSQKAMDEYYEMPIPDQRINHMLKDNHKVLADALIKNKSFDLAELDWHKGLLSVSTSGMLKDQLSPVPLR
tara:strand:- start:1502 stop:2248 length:747 start_codon:yes stop_codon:yes gene_type:complete